MIRTLVQDYEYIHLGLGLLGNLSFVVGSVLFYRQFEQLYALAVTLFVAGSMLMFLGSLGSVLKVLYQRAERSDDADRRQPANR